MAKVLVVEDSYVMRQKIIGVLTQYGHTVVGEAKNGAQAYTEYALHKPDLVTMDINMPDSNGMRMNGVDTVQKIIGSFPDAKIVMISAIGQKSMVLTAIQSGAKNYIVKPFEDDKFIGVINRVLGIDTMKKRINALENPESLQSTGGDKKSEKRMAFSVSLGNDIFTISINENFDKSCTSFLSTAVKGLAFVEPLKVVVDFTHVDNLDEPVLDGIFEALALIEQSNGSLRYFSGSSKFIQLINNSNRDIQIERYSNSPELSVETLWVNEA